MAENKRDYYEVLALSKGASDDEIKKAYRKLAKQFHPDLHPGDKQCEAKFKELSEAYEVLSDSEKKAKYDQYGHAAFDPNSGFGGYGDFGGFGGFDDLGDILGNIFGGFGGSAGRNGPRRGESARTSVSISFEEAAFGCSKEVSFARIEDCKVCGGSGAESGTSPETCSDCGGTGSVRVAQRTPFGVMNASSPCRKCGGAGKIIHRPCSTCAGKGKVRKNCKLSVNIPAGIDDRQTISLGGQGHAGTSGGGAGDLLITVSVKAHSLFRREGTSVLLELPISFVQATLGAEIEVPTLDGKVKYSIPEGTKTGAVFRFRGKGIPFLKSKSGRGDQYVTVSITTPKALTAEQKALLRAFGDAMGEAPDTDDTKGSFFDKRRKKK